MALPPDHIAGAILRTLVMHLKLRAGQGALLETVLQNVRSEGINHQAFENGLRAATEKGWIVYDRTSHSVRLTDEGFAAVHSAVSWS
jgi:hypothetical protein